MPGVVQRRSKVKPLAPSPLKLAPHGPLSLRAAVFLSRPDAVVTPSMTATASLLFRAISPGSSTVPAGAAFGSCDLLTCCRSVGGARGSGRPAFEADGWAGSGDSDRSTTVSNVRFKGARVNTKPQDVVVGSVAAPLDVVAGLFSRRPTLGQRSRGCC